MKICATCKTILERESKFVNGQFEHEYVHTKEIDCDNFRPVNVYHEYDPQDAAYLCATIEANVANNKLTDKQFREFVERSLPVAQVGLDMRRLD